MSESETKSESKPRRRWLRFNLRTLFVLMTIAAVWLGFTMKRLREQEGAVARILELGGQVVYDYQLDDDGSKILNAQPPGPAWLRRILGPQWNVRVVTVQLEMRGDPRARGTRGPAPRDRATDDDVEILGHLRDLEVLIVQDARFTDEGLTHLQDLTRLSTLDLGGCKIDGSGLKYIERLPITSLRLNATQITDDSLSYVASLTELEDLELFGTRVTSRGMVHLRDLKQLRNLKLHATAINDEAIEHLARLRELRTVGLLDTDLTSEGAAKLKAALPNLQQMHYAPNRRGE